MAPQERNSLSHEDSMPPKSCDGTGFTDVPLEPRPVQQESLTTHDQRLLQRLSGAQDDSKAKNSEDAFVNKGFQSDPSDENQNIEKMPKGRPDKRLPPPDNPEEEKLTDFDDLLPHIGEFGLYQKILFLLMIPFTFFVAFVYFAQIFMTLVPENYWCKVPQLENLTQAQRVKLSIPMSESGSPAHCEMYDVDWTKFLSDNTELVPDPNWPKRYCDFGWEFNLTDVPYHTISTELGWVCNDDNKGATAQAIFFCGAIVGGLIFGWLADKYGRIPALVGTNVVGFVAGVATAFCNSFWMFCVCRFLVGLAFDNCFTMMYILVLEYVGPKWRTFVANMSIALFFTLASCLLPWIAWFLADWRWLAVVTSAPLALAIATPWLVPESARWLVSQGKFEEAVVILKKFEKINKAKIPEKVMKDFTESCLKIQKEEETSSVSYSVLDLFKTPRLRKTVILLILIWMMISLVFDGHVRNVGSLGLDVFLTFTVAAATELPADTFLTAVLDRWGRRWLACGSMVASGLFSLLATLAPIGAFSATLAIVGRLAVNISYNIGLQYAAELLPTVVRAQGVALIHIMGYVASILAPFIVYLVTVYQPLPLLILGTLGVVGGLLCLFLPETVDKLLPQSLQDGEDFGKDQKFWEFPCIGQKIEDVPHDYPGFYLRRSSLAMSIRSVASSRRSSTFDASIRRSSVFDRTGTLRATGRASVRGSIRAETLMRHRTVSMSSKGAEA